MALKLSAHQVRKGLKIAYISVTSLFFIVAFLAVMRLVFVNPTQERSLFGFQFYIVLSDSMKPSFEAGDLIITRQVDTQSLNVGDIITFRSIDPMSFNEIITHEIVEVTTFQGERAFTTRGVNNNTDDAFPALSSAVLGVYRTNVPMLGRLFSFLGTWVGYVLLIVIPFILLLTHEISVLVRYLKSKKEEERQKVQAEKEALLAEIEALRASRKKGRPKKEKPVVFDEGELV